MILESIVTTANSDGSSNISPMGPKIQPLPSPSSTSSPPCQTDTAATLPDVKQLLNKSENYKTGLQSAQLRSKLIACQS